MFFTNIYLIIFLFLNKIRTVFFQLHYSSTHIFLFLREAAKFAVIQMARTKTCDVFSLYVSVQLFLHLEVI